MKYKKIDKTDGQNILETAIVSQRYSKHNLETTRVYLFKTVNQIFRQYVSSESYENGSPTVYDKFIDLSCREMQSIFYLYRREIAHTSISKYVLRPFNHYHHYYCCGCSCTVNANSAKVWQFFITIQNLQL